MNKQVIFGIFAGISFVFLGYFLLSEASFSSSREDFSLSDQEEYTFEGSSYNTQTQPSNNQQNPLFFGNITDVVVNDIGSRFLSDIESLSQDDEKTNELIERIQNEGISSDILSEDISPQSIGFINDLSDSDVRISTSALPSDEDRYLESIDTIFSDLNLGEEQEILRSALEKMTDDGDVSEIRRIASQYRNIIEALQNTPVPSYYLDFHKSIVIAFWNLSLFLDSMAQVDVDPIRTMVAVEYYPTIQQQWEDFIVQLNVIQSQ